MPQMNRGGKFIFGKSTVHADGTVPLPPQAVTAYHIAAEGRVYLWNGSRTTGGFCVTRKGLFYPSALGHILDELAPLRDYTAEPGAFIPYKGRAYCWTAISATGQVTLTKEMMAFLEITYGTPLLSIRSSDMAFTMGAKGPLLEKAENFKVETPAF